MNELDGAGEPGYLQKNDARFGPWNCDSRAKLGQVHHQIEPYGTSQHGFVKGETPRHIFDNDAHMMEALQHINPFPQTAAQTQSVVD